MNENESRDIKNAIFAAKEAAAARAASGGAPTMSKEEHFKKSFGLDIPVSEVPLPSLGLIYPLDHPLNNQKVVDIRGMTTREEDILMSKALIRKGTVITELIKSCMVTPNVDVQSLIGGDRNALMVSVRILGYGSLYEGEAVCPSCGHKNTIAVELNALDIKELEVEPVMPNENRFAFFLPRSGKNIEFKFITGREEEEMLAAMEMRKKKGISVDSVITTRLQYSIISVEGATDKATINNFISFMPAMDSAALRSYMDKVEPGVDMKFDFTCKECNHYEEMPLPLGPTFFWPNARKS